jgi:hypothetical protein
LGEGGGDGDTAVMPGAELASMVVVAPRSRGRRLDRRWTMGRAGGVVWGWSRRTARRSWRLHEEEERRRKEELETEHEKEEVGGEVHF